MKSYSEREENERRHFNMLAKKYDDNYGYKDTFTKYKIAKKASSFTKLVKEYQFDKGGVILEMGCGTGVYTREVAKDLPNSQIIALDISETIVQVAKRASKKHRNIKYQVASVYDTKLKDASVDVIFGFYVLHHLNEECLQQKKLSELVLSDPSNKGKALR